MTERTVPLLVALGFILLFGLFMIREPVFGGYNRLGEDLAEAQAEETRLRQAIRDRQDSRDEASRARDAFGEPISPAAREGRRSRFYSQIETMALGSNLQVASLAPRPERLEESGIIGFPVSVSLDGDMTGLVAFLAQVRSTPAVIEVERLVVRRRDNVEAPLAVQADLVAYGFVDEATRKALAEEAEGNSRRRSGNG